jgi:phage head maturation protease
MSFAFSVAQGGEKWKQERDQTVRVLLEVNLHDMALVVRPA